MYKQIETCLDTLETLRGHHRGDGSNLDTDWRKQLEQQFKAVQQAYLDVIRRALSLLVQNHQTECLLLLQEQRDLLEPAKFRIAAMVADPDAWLLPATRSGIEYLFTRARLVDELKMFPSFALDLLERHSFDQSIEETITHLEYTMTGRKSLYETLLADLTR